MFPPLHLGRARRHRGIGRESKPQQAHRRRLAIGRNGAGCAAGDAPQVEVSIDTSGALQVIDNGFGFAKEHAAKIFEPFTRLTDDPAYRGLGLGLAAVKKWLDRHGGWIRVESREGGPTRFIISFED